MIIIMRVGYIIYVIMHGASLSKEQTADLLLGHSTQQDVSLLTAKFDNA